MNPIRLLLVAGDPLARAGLAALLTQQPALQVVGQLAPDPDLVTHMAAYQPAVVVWDVGWTPQVVLGMLTAVTEIGKPVLALVPDAAAAGEIWATGVRGLLLRTAAVDVLAAALIGLAHELVVLEPTLAAVTASAPAGVSIPLAEPLTGRELEVLRRVAEGLSNKLIARELAISEHTVKFHVNAILGKLGAQSRTEAVVRATRIGLILL
ncbi:MAG: response regulator transcription factor [Chloroflexota bacterium]|nr:response regulator transcription factor [Chloroflexota bacterium]